MAQGTETRVADGALRPGLVYVLVQSPVGPPLHVPFATYDDWSLRDRYNEALRIVNTLGASHVDCQTFREAKKGGRLRVGVKGFGGRGGIQKVQNSGFDYSHTGTGSPARDPRPLQWPHEPGFAAAVEGVLDNKATQVTINIHSSQTYSANGSTGQNATQARLRPGGERRTQRGLEPAHHRAVPGGQEVLAVATGVDTAPVRVERRTTDKSADGAPARSVAMNRPQSGPSPPPSTAKPGECRTRHVEWIHGHYPAPHRSRSRGDAARGAGGARRSERARRRRAEWT